MLDQAHPDALEPVLLAAGAQRFAGLATKDALLAEAGTLALHGWLDNAASFGAMARYWSGGPLIAADLPGHGHSPAGRANSFGDLLADIAGLAEATGWQRITLLGHSMGGALASLLAGTQPSWLHRLILIEALGPLSQPAEQMPDLLGKALSERARFADRRRTFDQLEDAIRVRASKGHFGEDVAGALVQRGIEKVAGGWRWSTDPRLTLSSLTRLTESQVEACLRNIVCPTLLITADRGIFQRYPDMLEQRKLCVRDLVSHQISGGHHLHMEVPAVIVDTIADFTAG